jgi:hypothetical protein
MCGGDVFHGFLAETRPDFATLETVPPNIEDAYLRLVQISND